MQPKKRGKPGRLRKGRKGTKQSLNEKRPKSTQIRGSFFPFTKKKNFRVFNNFYVYGFSFLLTPQVVGPLQNPSKKREKLTGHRGDITRHHQRHRVDDENGRSIEEGKSALRREQNLREEAQSKEHFGSTVPGVEEVGTVFFFWGGEGLGYQCFFSCYILVVFFVVCKLLVLFSLCVFLFNDAMMFFDLGSRRYLIFVS